MVNSNVRVLVIGSCVYLGVKGWLIPMMSVWLSVVR